MDDVKDENSLWDSVDIRRLEGNSDDVLLRDMVKRMRESVPTKAEIRRVDAILFYYLQGVQLTTADRRWLLKYQDRPLKPASGKPVLGLPDATRILMDLAGLDRRSGAAVLYKAVEMVRKRLTLRLAPELFEIEGIWSDGTIRRRKWPHCSTGVAIMQLEGLDRHEVKVRCDKCQDRPGKDGLGRLCKTCDGTGYSEITTHSRAPMLVRVFHDGLLVREWDQKNNRYNLELD